MFAFSLMWISPFILYLGLFITLILIRFILKKYLGTCQKEITPKNKEGKSLEGVKRAGEQRKPSESFRPKLSLDIETSPIINPSERASSEAKPYYLIFDTESFDAIEERDDIELHEGRRSPIIALSWQILDQNKNLILEESHIIRRKRRMTDKAKAIHHITEGELRRGDDLTEVLNRFCEVLHQCPVVVAHFLDYHIEAVRWACSERGLDNRIFFDKEYICTMMKGLELGFKRRANGERAFPKLDELFAYLYFARPNIELHYRSKTLRDIRLVSASLRRLA